MRTSSFVLEIGPACRPLPPNLPISQHIAATRPFASVVVIAAIRTGSKNAQAGGTFPAHSGQQWVISTARGSYTPLRTTLALACCSCCLKSDLGSKQSRCAWHRPRFRFNVTRRRQRGSVAGIADLIPADVRSRDHARTRWGIRMKSRSVKLSHVQTRQVQVILGESVQPEIEEILRRHHPLDLPTEKSAA
jgi:hypothetical protein